MCFFSLFISSSFVGGSFVGGSFIGGSFISGGFVSSLKGVGEGIVDVAVWILVNIPYLIVYGAVLFAAVKLIRVIRKKRPVKKVFEKKKEETKEAPGEE